ncbi:hypothetical protein DFH09DRAFT_280357 [Mycena vulgaris]|nr:hypothetical protein DFH09DRAFT_280357 [Mycena vulgaris]
MPARTDRRTLHPLSVSSGKSNPLPPPPRRFIGHYKSNAVAGRPIKREKIHECPQCDRLFSRPCDVRAHQNMHTGEQPFLCVVRSCRRRFGLRSNMLRHNILHGLPRTGAARPTAPYAVAFGPLIKGPPVPSDTTLMSSEVVWNSEGPFVKRQAHFPASRVARQ